MSTMVKGNMLQKCFDDQTRFPVGQGSVIYRHVKMEQWLELSCPVTGVSSEGFSLQLEQLLQWEGEGSVLKMWRHDSDQDEQALQPKKS